MTRFLHIRSRTNVCVCGGGGKPWHATYTYLFSFMLLCLIHHHHHTHTHTHTHTHWGVWGFEVLRLLRSSRFLKFLILWGFWVFESLSHRRHPGGGGLHERRWLLRARCCSVVLMGVCIRNNSSLPQTLKNLKHFKNLKRLTNLKTLKIAKTSKTSKKQNLIASKPPNYQKP